MRIQWLFANCALFKYRGVLGPMAVEPRVQFQWCKIFRFYHNLDFLKSQLHVFRTFLWYSSIPPYWIWVTMIGFRHDSLFRGMSLSPCRLFIFLHRAASFSPGTILHHFVLHNALHFVGCSGYNSRYSHVTCTPRPQGLKVIMKSEDCAPQKSNPQLRNHWFKNYEVHHYWFKSWCSRGVLGSIWTNYCAAHQEITRVILCRLFYIVMSFKPFNDIIMIVCKFLIGLCCLRSYST